MYILHAFTLLLLLTQAVLAQQTTPILPDPTLTPGDTFDVTVQDVCVPGYAKKVRAVPAWLKRQAYAEYGITEYKTGDYEVDHLIPLSLGGSNSIRNRWPQSTKTSPWNSYVKDAFERKLHQLVAAGDFDVEPNFSICAKPGVASGLIICIGLRIAHTHPKRNRPRESKLLSPIIPPAQLADYLKTLGFFEVEGTA